MSKFLALLLFPAYALAVIGASSLSASNASASATNAQSFGGKITSVNSCRCPYEPQKALWKQISYSPRFDGSKKGSGSLFYKAGITKLYDHQKLSSGIWHLGTYDKGFEQCLYMTEADIADGGQTCSGVYTADGTIKSTGTSKGQKGGLGSLFGF